MAQEPFEFRMELDENQLSNINNRFFPPLPQDIPSTAADAIKKARASTMMLYYLELQFASQKIDGKVHEVTFREGDFSESTNMQNAINVLAGAWEGALPENEAKMRARRDADYCIEKLANAQDMNLS